MGVKIIMGKLLKGGLSGGLILFIWSTLSWNILGWQLSAFDQFPSESSRSELMQKIPASGMYFFSSPQQNKNVTTTQNHQIFVAVHTETQANAQSIQLVISLLTQIFAALLITGLLLLKPHMQYTKRLSQVLLFAAAASIVTYLPYMNQFYFSWQYTSIAMLNLLIGWLLASFAIAYVTRPNYPRFN
jgi:hypothetical protein